MLMQQRQLALTPGKIAGLFSILLGLGYYGASSPA
jgi:hypothetical protein